MSIKTIGKAIEAIKLHLVVIPLKTKLKKYSCLLLSSCGNLETGVYACNMTYHESSRSHLGQPQSIE
jgi:hypothetical protein